MDAEVKELLRRNLALSEENNKILRGLRRTNRFSAFIRILYWVIVVGIAFGAYYWMQPYIEQLLTTFHATSEQLQSVSSIVQKINQYLPH